MLVVPDENVSVSPPAAPHETEAPPTYECPPNLSAPDPVVPKAEPAAQSEAAQPSIPLDCSRHPTLWYPEGTVVVRVDKTYYRLFRTYLTRHSRFFADAVTAFPASGEESADSVDGCPVIEVPGLRPKDFEVWLAALENGTTYAQRTPSYPEAASLLRASSALASDGFLELAKWAMARLWPADFDVLSSPPPVHKRDALEAIVLARAHALPASVLKLAFWWILHFESPVRVALEARASGTPSTALCDADVELLATAHCRLSLQWATDAIESNRVLLEQPCFNAEDVFACSRPRMLRAGSPQFPTVRSYRNLSSHPEIFFKTLCPLCVDRLREFWAERMRMLWDEMGAWLDPRVDGEVDVDMEPGSGETA